MRKNKYFFVLLIIIFSIVISVLISNDNPQKQGSYLENISDFAKTSQLQSEITGWVKSYFSAIHYTIVEIDNESMVAVVELSVPNLVDEFEGTLDKVLSENEDISRELAGDIMKNELDYLLTNEILDYEKIVVTVPLVREGLSLKLCPNENWYEVISCQFVDLYREYYILMIEELTDESPN